MPAWSASPACSSPHKAGRAADKSPLKGTTRVLSLNRSMRAIEETEAANRAAATAFAEAAATAARHVVEVNAEEAQRFRSQVMSLAQRLGGQPNPDELVLARNGFQNELKEYAAKATGDVRRMKEELSAAAEAMRSFAQGVTDSGSEHEAVLKREFQLLTRAADSPEITTIRAAVHETVATVSASYQELKQAHNLAVAQLRDEIRVLHQALHKEPKPAKLSELLSKQELDRRIEELLRRRQPFTLVLARFPESQATPPPAAVLERATSLCLDNLRAVHPEQDGALGEFASHLYGLLVPGERKLAIGNLEQQCATCHVYQDRGIPRTLKWEPRLALAAYTPADSPATFFERLSRATDELRPPL